MDPNEAKNEPKKDPEFSELRSRREFDRKLRVERAIEAGMTREQAERHADEHYEGEARMRGQSAEEATETMREHGIRNPDYD